MFLKMVFSVAVVAALAGGSAGATAGLGLRVTEEVKRSWVPYELPQCVRPCRVVSIITIRQRMPYRDAMELRRLMEDRYGAVVTMRHGQGGMVYTLYKE